MLRRLHKGQSTAEYAIVIGLVIGAAVAMQIYVKRGLQAKVKVATDFNDSAAVNKGILGKTLNGQFEPDYVYTTKKGGMHATSDTTEKISTKEGGSVTREIQGQSTSSNTGTQITVGQY